MYFVLILLRKVAVKQTFYATSWNVQFYFYLGPDFVISFSNTIMICQKQNNNIYLMEKRKKTFSHPSCSSSNFLFCLNHWKHFNAMFHQDWIKLWNISLPLNWESSFNLKMWTRLYKRNDSAAAITHLVIKPIFIFDLSFLCSRKKKWVKNICKVIFMEVHIP